MCVVLGGGDGGRGEGVIRSDEGGLRGGGEGGDVSPAGGVGRDIRMLMIMMMVMMMMMCTV